MRQQGEKNEIFTGFLYFKKTMEEKANGRVGLANLGQTCYINAVVQSLRYSPDLNKYFLTGDYKQHLKMDRRQAPVVVETMDVMKGMWTADVRFRASMSPRGFLGAINRAIEKDRGREILSGDQADSAEFLQFLLESIHYAVARPVQMDIVGVSKNLNDELHIKALESWRDFHRKEYSCIVENFYGQTLTTLTCQRCQNKSPTYEPWLMLKPPVENNKRQVLSECITTLFEPETLPDYKCSKCGLDSEGPAIKEHSIARLPSNLIVHLKRFDYNGKKAKNHVEVNLQSTNMTQWLSFPAVARNTNPVYTTYAVIEHHGNPRGGHYIAYTRHNDKWLCYDDTSINYVDESRVINDNTYILFMTNKPYSTPTLP